MKINQMKYYFMIVILMFVSLIFTQKSNAHCDTMDGPVVKAAQKALETGNINYVLVWVQKKDEDEIKKAFDKTVSVRKVNKDVQEMADMYFFETVVRVHRMGEGEPYTGIKPAGTDLGPVIPEADKSLETGNSDKLFEIILNAVKSGISQHYKEAIEKKEFNVNNLIAGREYIKAYVEFMHYVEKIYEATVNISEHEHH